MLRDVDADLFAEHAAEPTPPSQPPSHPAPSAAQSWTCVPVGAQLHLRMQCEQRGYCYLFHLNEVDELCVVFPNIIETRDNRASNVVPAPGHVVHVPGGFEAGGKRYLAFKNAAHLERETFYLLTISERLEDFEAVGALPTKLTKLPSKQARAVVDVLRRAAGAAAGSTLRDLDGGLFDEMASEGSGPTMALSTMTLISVRGTA